jgi:rhodanese-related sulfurtransferase
VAQQLINKGYQQAYALLGGFDAWRAAGYPLEKK